MQRLFEQRTWRDYQCQLAKEGRSRNSETDRQLFARIVGRACGIGSIRADVPADGEFTVDCGGIEYAAEVSATPFYDPTNSRLKS